MRAVYYRRDARTPWYLLGAAKTNRAAEALMRAEAMRSRVGQLVYLETRAIAASVWSLRSLGKTNLILRRSAKSFLAGWKPIRYHDRRHWVQHNANQTAFVFETKPHRKG